MTDMGIKTDFRMLLNLGNKTGVNIDSEIWIGSQIWESGLHSWLQFHKNENLLICQWDFQKYGIDQVQYVDHKRLVILFHDGLAQDPNWLREVMKIG